MEEELREALTGIKSSQGQTEANLRNHIESAVGRVDGKLDMINQQFNTHLIEDTKSFTRLELQQEQLEKKLSDAERKRREESDRRLMKVEADKVRIDQWRLMRAAGYFAMVAAIMGSLIASLLTLAEHRAERAERAQQIRTEDHK